MSEMVERVARALWEKIGGELESYNIEMGCGKHSEKIARDDIAEAARAAIEAMLPVPEGLAEAAVASMFKTIHGAPEPNPFEPHEARIYFTAMIKTALKEPA